MKSLSILVADDVEEIQRLLRQWLTESGHDVMCVAGGFDGTRLLHERSFDLIIADVLMPDGDGLELIENFKRAAPAGRVLAISGGGKYMPKDVCIKIANGFGAHAALEKPFNRDQLLAGVGRALEAAV